MDGINLFLSGFLSVSLPYRLVGPPEDALQAELVGQECAVATSNIRIELQMSWGL